VVIFDGSQIPRLGRVISTEGDEEKIRHYVEEEHRRSE